MKSIKPAILIYTSSRNEKVLKELCAGIEEEGVPFEVNMFKEGFKAEELSRKAAESSIVEAGIGVDRDKACFYCTILKTKDPLMKADVKADKILRTLGSNAARYIKKIPFKLNE
ncbi:glycerol dehydratase reactivase beta/small subunit family protein [Clostridium sp. SYSU_GA19001]|uniref:glycerol dehydratase reactivase beta/small subunit family protein n=1 Tax=Clostridium caldaquaticum TaxID=2940653 RepID=UPI0020775FA3|nr:glycerol dehydratase reactivase beta/small subunit family protein [Clostridium caldaquaticum]MCM8710029.1 glycerol dehydratase reactivase beta/small subunit family protein [Clostridium caldaquaticum]